MPAPIGFVILSHGNPGQLLRLIQRLNVIYETPSVACHHDFAQSAFRTNEFPSNVSFVLPHVRTGWGKWAVVEAALKALTLLYREADPEWFVLLSASDYPVKPAEEVLKDLLSGAADAYLDYRPMAGFAQSDDEYCTDNPMLSHFGSPENVALSWRRYVGAQFWIPTIRRREISAIGPRWSPWRLGRYTAHLPFTDPLSPFGENFRGFYGDHWFSGNRKVAQILLNPEPIHLSLRKYLRRRASVDECYYQTVLCNTKSLRINKNTKRFADWRGGGAHPRYLTEADLPKIFTSGAHFARKFNAMEAALDRIDEVLT